MLMRQGRARASTSKRSLHEPHRPGRWFAPLASLVLLAAFAATGSGQATDDATAVEAPPGVAVAPVVAETPATGPAAAATRPGADSPAATSSRAGAPPANLADLPAWLEYQKRSHLAALPLEARIFHRRGVLLRESGNPAEATRMVRGAAELDPAYLAPQLTLAEWGLTSEPSQSLLRYATVLDLARRNFLLQLSLAANALFAIVQAVFLGLLATGLILVFVRRELLLHAWEEWLRRFISARTARYWSWALLMLPFAFGFGLVLPTLLLLGALWTHLRPRERFVFVTLAASFVALPLLGSALDRLTLPLDASRAPLHGVALIESEPLTMERTAELAEQARSEPTNPYLQFAAGWASRRTGHLDDAEHFYRKALERWPSDDRTLNNLGCALMMRGETDEAVRQFTEAARVQPRNAGAWFNLAQVHTQRFDYRAASDALSRASALDFELVKNAQNQSTEDGSLPLVEEWIAPGRMWGALAAARVDAGNRGALPPAWRQHLETRGWPFSLAAGLVALAGILAGLRLSHSLPLRPCSNCERVTCRRCSERRREHAVCNKCVEAEKRAESPDFARMLLLRRRRRRERVVHLVRTALAALVPGFGLLSLQRVFSPLLLLIASAGLLAPWFADVQPFAFEPRLALDPPGLPWPVQAAGWIVIYAWSLLGYFQALSRRATRASESAAPPRPRPNPSTRRASLSEAA